VLIKRWEEKNFIFATTLILDGIQTQQFCTAKPVRYVFLLKKTPKLLINSALKNYLLGKKRKSLLFRLSRKKIDEMRIKH
jgi:hypothetical protein